MVELVDTLDSGSSVRKDMEVQVLSSALKRLATQVSLFFTIVIIMRKILFVLFLSFLLGCAEDVFQECQSISIEEMRKIPAEGATARSCYTLTGDITYQYDQNLCQRKPCFFLYEIDSKEKRLNTFIYLSDSLNSGILPNWKDTSNHEITRITGYYYPNRIPSTTPLTPDSQEAFFVMDIE